MIAGLPGAGISALFYLICVALMPFHALARSIAARRASAGRWRLVTYQLVLGGGIMITLVAAGLAVSVLAPPQAGPGQGGGVLANAVVSGALALGRLGVVVGLITLTMVLGTVVIIGRFDRRPLRNPVDAPLTARPLIWSTATVSRRAADGRRDLFKSERSSGDLER